MYLIFAEIARQLECGKAFEEDVPMIVSVNVCVYVKYDALWEALTDLCMQSYSSPDKCRNNCKYKGNPFFLPIGLPSWISWLELVQSLFYFPDKMKSFTREITCTLPNCDVNNHKYLLTLNTCTFDMIQSSDVTVKDDSAKFVGSIKPRAITKRELDTPLPSPFPLPTNYPKEVMAGLSMGVRQITFDIKNGPSNPAKELGSCCDRRKTSTII